MAMNLQSLRDELRNSLGVDSTDFPNARVDELLNRALTELTRKFPFREKETSTNFATIADTPKYTLPVNFDSLIDISIQGPDSLQSTPLNRSTKVNYDASLNATPLASTQDPPIPCEYVRENDCIILWPTPAIAYNVKIRYLKGIADLTDTNSALGLPPEWHEIVLLGATWRGFISMGDYERANASKAHQISLLSSTVPVEATEEFDTHYGGVEVYGYDRGARL